MEMIIQQAFLKLNHYEYKCYIKNELVFIGTANRTVLPAFRKIRLSSPDRIEIASLEQIDFVRFAISQIPIIGWIPLKRCPYIYYKNGLECGKMEEFIFKPIVSGKIGCDSYTIYTLKDNDYAIFRNDIQVGLIRRNPWKIGDADKYTVVYEKVVTNEQAALLALLNDITRGTSDTSWSTASYEKTLYVWGTKGDNNWLPGN